MKINAAAKLQERRLRQKRQTSKLNLVSLMDIFTILVFFLLVNSTSDVQVLQTDETIKLPKSTAQQKPEITTVVRVNGQQLFVGDRFIAKIDDIDLSAENIQPLMTELNYRAERAGELSETQKIMGRAVTILGDEQVPYELLKQIMQTCAAADFRDMSFAVEQTAPEEPSGVDT
ncbi:biopolymer transporter ExbD [Microbulbifer sp. OS29]|uniref:Biopolymer transporter ExbD n=1 Tax=Microbulbifer okhotskensis TaxID=2926617 RepID=A0A9X2J3Z1_9GAMM|nr:biopolymer transporter ExbD [Microbulbifer okhotskensis]MCO1332759.1 biopolymer transporter ExbD [Microbulbifer okhotskensis]